MALSQGWLFRILGGLALCAGLAFLAVTLARNGSQDEYVGLSKTELWELLCRKSGTHGTPITAFDYAPDASGTRHAMLTVEDASNMPEVFRTASRWRWDSQDRRFHTFSFDAAGRVSSVKVDSTSRL
jgi:hypothetical protein